MLSRILKMRGCIAVKMTAVFMVLIIIIFCAPGIYGNTDSEKTVRVGFFSFEGYYEVSSTGNRTGYGYDLIQMMAAHSDINYKYIDNVKTWGEMEDMLADGRLDMLTCVQKTPENEKRFAFSSTPISTSSTMMTVRSGSDHFVPGKYSTYDGARVGVMRNNAHAARFAAFAKKHGFTYTPVYFDSLEALEEALQSGRRIDACVTSSLRPLHNEWIIEQFDPQPFYMMMRKSDTSLINEVNSSLAQMDVSSPDWRTELYSKYYSADNGDNLLLTAAERKYISTHRDKVYRVAVNPDNAPYSYYSGGRLQGIIPMVFDEIADRAGIRYKVVRTTSLRAYEKLVDSHKVDLVMDAGWDYSSAENKGYKLSNPYMELTVALLAKKDRTDIRNVITSYEAISDCLANSSLNSKYSCDMKTSSSGVLSSLTSGSCDAALLYSGAAERIMNADGGGKYKITILPEMDVDMAVASNKDNSYLLLSVLSKSADSVKTDYVQQVREEYFSERQGHLKLIDYLYINPGVGMGVIFVLSLIVIFLVVILNQRSRIRREQEFNEELRKAKMAADRANEFKSSFLSSMSHDLRTPLNGIVGFTDIALREADENKKQEYLGKIKSSADLLTDLVEDTLELSRIESGKMSLEPSIVNGDELIDSIVAALRPAAELKGVGLNKDVLDCPLEMIFIDRIKIQKVILNLLSNAIKYTPAGGSVILRIEKLEPPKNGATRRIIVEDNGIGMSREFLGRIYEPFAQENRAEAGNVTGTGLGLSIVKKTVEIMGGTIEVESRINEGTRFTIDLPVQTEECSERNSGETEAQVQLMGRRILLCEDNMINAEIAETLLKENGMLVDCAENGAIGLEKFLGSESGYYDVVLMDIRMPVMDGLEAARTIREMKRADAQVVPIIAMTANAYDEDMRKSREAGMDAHLSKPVLPEQLYETLAKYTK